MEDGQFVEEGGIKAEALPEAAAVEAALPDAGAGEAVLPEADAREADLPGAAAGEAVLSQANAGEPVREEKNGPVSLREEIAAAFPGRRQDIRSYSALSLAYIGDVVYDLIIRTAVVGKGNRPVNDLHRLTVKYVSAGAQAKIVQALSEILTEEERTVFRRGKNSKPHTTARNASLSDYLKATGFEAVLGYLYLTDNMERALELVKKGIVLAFNSFL